MGQNTKNRDKGTDEPSKIQHFPQADLPDCTGYACGSHFGKHCLKNFYIFTFEDHFREIEEDTDKLQPLKETYSDITGRLEKLCIAGELDEYTKQTICEMSEKVLGNIAENYEKIKSSSSILLPHSQGTAAPRALPLPGLGPVCALPSPLYRIQPQKIICRDMIQFTQGDHFFNGQCVSPCLIT